MKCVWEELHNLNVFLMIDTISLEIIVFFVALNKQRLFQFLNGLEDHYNHQRSQILMIVHLPNVESVCSLIRQEESQRLLFGSTANVKSTTLYNKGNVKDKCTICGFKWHPPEKCYEKGQGRKQGALRTAAYVESGNISITPQQFEQLLK
ncbi:hypothetical protein Tco_0240262, partial [Tanacetum coccineum]